MTLAAANERGCTAVSGQSSRTNWGRTSTLYFCTATLILCGVYGWQVAMNSWFAMPPKPIGDGLDYENLAYHLWRGEGFAIRTDDVGWQSVYLSDLPAYNALLDSKRDFLDTGRPPLYPMVIASIYCLIGRGPVAFQVVRMLSVLALAVAGGLATSLAWQLLNQKHATGRTFSTTSSHIGAIATLGLAASNRTIADYATDFLTEPLTMLLVQAFVLSVLWRRRRDPCHDKATQAVRELDRALPSPSRRRHIVMGVLLGGMILARSVFVLWLPAIGFLLVLCAKGPLTVRFRNAATVLLIAACLCAPWWTRNMLVTGKAMPLGTKGPITLLGGYCDAAFQSKGDWQPEPEWNLRAAMRSAPEYARLSGTEFEVALAEAAKSQVFRWIEQNGNTLPRLFALRIVTHWNPYFGKSLLWKLLIVLGLVGLLLYGHRSNAMFLGGLLLTSTLLVAILYSAGGRFLVPLYGVLYLLGGVGVAFSFDLMQQRFARPIRSRPR